MEYFWKKKTVVSFVLSIFVFWTHTSVFSQYLLASGNTGSASETTVAYLQVFFTDTFVRVAVPLFFMLSGVLMFRDYDTKKYVPKLKTRFWSLVVPYLSWNTIAMLFSIVTSYTFISRFFVGREKFTVTVTSVLKSIFFHECNYPFWFIFSLILFVILSPVIDLLTRSKIVSFISLAALAAITWFDIPFFTELIHGLDSFVYYYIGCIIGRHFFKLFSEKCPKKISVAAIIVFVVCTVIWFIRGTGLFELPMPLTVVFLTVYALSFWYAADAVKMEKIRTKPFMNDSLLVYAMHVNVSAIIIKVIYLVLPKTVLCAIPNFILSSVLTVLVILLFAAVLRKYLNPVYLWLSGMKKKSIAR